MSKKEKNTEETARDQRVLQGLQKKKKCSLCLQEFFVAELPGAITYKSILNLRKSWGDRTLKPDQKISPSQLYKREELCIFCMQFFNVEGLQDSKGMPIAEKSNSSPNATSPKSH